MENKNLANKKMITKCYIILPPKFRSYKNYDLFYENLGLTKTYGCINGKYFYRDFKMEVEKYLLALHRYYCPEEENLYIIGDVFDTNGYLIPKQGWGCDVEYPFDDMEQDE